MNNTRGSGILFHISSLPSHFGVGDLGGEAHKFVDFLHASKQSYWQVLPLTPTKVSSGNSPYSSPSSFAGNILFISPQLLCDEGLIEKNDLKAVGSFSMGKVEYKKATAFKEDVLKTAFKNFKQSKADQESFDNFCEQNKNWLTDYALFMVLSEEFKNKPWNKWPVGFRYRKPEVLDEFCESHKSQISQIKFNQFIFYKQWMSLKRYANAKKINIIGDLPIYVHYNSVEVWCNPRLFKVDDQLKPQFVAGVPPDYFSKTGQRWGNPVYNWSAMKKNGYAWWLKRIKHNLNIYDLIRVDHFRGFSAYWQIPADEKTAVNGRWVKVPGHDFLNKVKDEFRTVRLIAEDVGHITPSVRKLIKDAGFPGMRIFQFAFEDTKYNKGYLPENYPSHCVAYTGTHDNTTIKDWYSNVISAQQKIMINKYMNADIDPKHFHWQFIERVMRSKADIVIFPLQDVLGLGKEAKMNRPGTSTGNWRWQLKTPLGDNVSDKLQKLVEQTNRVA